MEKTIIYISFKIKNTIQVTQEYLKTLFNNFLHKDLHKYLNLDEVKIMKVPQENAIIYMIGFNFIEM